MVGRGDRDEKDEGDESAPPAPPRLGQTDPRLFEKKTRADEYSAWAERLREKRNKNQQHIRQAQGEGDGDGSSPNYWTTEALYDESRRVQAEELGSGSPGHSNRELLALFNLTEKASAADITDAYRRLAKLHHPDRYVEADRETQDHHADQMQRINAAYRALKAARA